MAFPWVAVAMGALSIGASLFQSSSQNAAASASKSAAKKTARDQFIRAQLEFDIANQQNWTTNYAWDVARTEAQRFQDEQRKSDYEFSQMSIVDQAMDNLTLNVSGLLDKYKLEEQTEGAIRSRDMP